jgi:uncharacterized membrane protein YdjX (TVP38/TMEM64 family)
MGKFIKYVVIALVVLLVYLLNYSGVIIFDIEHIELLLKAGSQYGILIYLLMWLGKIVLFIPCISLIVIGGMYFGTIKGFFLSLAGLIISKSVIFFISKLLIKSKIENLINQKNPTLNVLIKKYNCKILLLSIICPIAPTDLLCFLAASSGISFKKFIITVSAASMPIAYLYSILGTSFKKSLFSIIAIGITIILVSVYSISLWNSLKGQQEYSITPSHGSK